MYQVKFFKGCLPQILLGPLLNTLSHIENYVSNSFPEWSKFNTEFPENQWVRLFFSTSCCFMSIKCNLFKPKPLKLKCTFNNLTYLSFQDVANCHLYLISEKKEFCLYN